MVQEIAGGADVVYIHDFDENNYFCEILSILSVTYFKVN